MGSRCSARQRRRHQPANTSSVTLPFNCATGSFGCTKGHVAASNAQMLRQRGLLAGVGVGSLPQQHIDNGGVAMPAGCGPRRARCHSRSVEQRKDSKQFAMPPGHGHPGAGPAPATLAWLPATAQGRGPSRQTALRGQGATARTPAPCLQAAASAVSPSASLSSKSPRQQPRLNSSRRQAACGQAPAAALQPGPGCSAATCSSVCLLASAWGEGQQAGHQGRTCRHAGTLNT